MPQSEDPSTELWRQEKELADLTSVLQDWRGTFEQDTET